MMARQSEVALEYSEKGMEAGVGGGDGGGGGHREGAGGVGGGGGDGGVVPRLLPSRWEEAQHTHLELPSGTLQIISSCAMT